MRDSSKRDSAQSYLDAFTEFQEAQTLYQEARRTYRADRDLYEHRQQDYLIKAAKVAVIAKRLGIKPLGGFTPRLLVPLGQAS